MLKEQIVICWSEICDRQPNNNRRVKSKKYFFILIVRSLLKFWQVAVCNGVFEYKLYAKSNFFKIGIRGRGQKKILEERLKFFDHERE